MDKMRDEFVTEMNRLKDALSNTQSPYLKRDYDKAYSRMKKELEEYDSFKKKAVLLNGE